MSTRRNPARGSALHEEVLLNSPAHPDGDRPSIVDLLRNRILNGLHLGDLRPGDRLPSIRDLSRSLGAGFSTVVQSYDTLEGEGLVEKRARSGMYVASPEPPGDELRPDTAQWLVGVLEEAYEQQIKIPHLSEFIRSWTAAVRLRCACVESDEDHRTALCAEMRQYFGLDAHPLDADQLPVPSPETRINDERLPTVLREADLLVTTVFHASATRAAAEALQKPFVVMTVSKQAVAAAEQRLREGGLTVVCVDSRFGERVRGIAGGQYRVRVQVVLAGDQKAIAELDGAGVAYARGPGAPREDPSAPPAPRLSLL
jgi:DNA-binding transcriptional regulator YhcF (GntR family)